MSKRKRDEDGEASHLEIEDRAIRIKASRLKAKVDQGHQILTAALKLARGFERQKMGRRQKQASGDPHTLLRLREEVIILKKLDLGPTAQRYLFKQMAKTKRIAESVVFLTIYGASPKVEGPKAGAEANVIGRLFKSNPVAEVLPGILQGIRGVVGQNKPLDTTNTAALPISSVSETLSDAANDNAHVTATDGLETDDTDEDMLDAYADRLARSSDESDSDFSGFGDDSKSDRERTSVSPSLSESITDEEIPKDTTSHGAVKAPSNTTFLPSLNMGGYYSGSESGGEEETYEKKPAIPPQRKNRRGQRARQQIAEKKYGNSAKHLQNQKPETKQTTTWDARKGAVNRSDRRSQTSGSRRPVKTVRASGANDEAVNPSKTRSAPASSVKKSEGALHPSWEAARKKKMETNKHMTAFAGKKITFD